MTIVSYEPERPALEFVGHAGAGFYGQDPVCAALSMLMYTLIEACPDARVLSGDGYCRIEAAPRTVRTSGMERASGAPGGAQRSGSAGEEENGGSGYGAFATLGESGMERASFDVILGGLRLLAKSYPAHVRLIYRSGKGGEHEPRKDGRSGGGESDGVCARRS